MFYLHQSTHQSEHTQELPLPLRSLRNIFSERILFSALIAYVKSGNCSAVLPCEKMFSNGKNALEYRHCFHTGRSEERR